MKGCTFLVASVLWVLSVASTDAYSALAPSSSAKAASVVVVGGGPIGLATAITLARPPHSCQVTVLEQQVGNGQAKYDPTRSYLYNVNSRGLLWFDRHNATATRTDTPFLGLSEKGSAPSQGMGMIMTVPADPNVPLVAPRLVTIGSGNFTAPMKRSYWIPRHQMVELLQEECRKENITLLHGKEVKSMTATEDSVTVHCADDTAYTSSSEHLIHRSTDGWLAAPKWRVRRYKSPATGVKLKALQFPPNFTIPNGTESIATESEGIYVFRGVKDGPRTRLSLGFLPVKDPNLVRPANTNTRYNHVIWSLKDGPTMKQYFQENFPRLQWDDYVSEEEWERFAKANGTIFPYCQYTTGAAVWSPSGKAGVVLVGDACHAFPPDIGQGINAGLQDVVALDQSLRGEDVDTRILDKSSTASRPSTPRLLSEALASYQTNRVPEHEALIDIARFGSPYQYRQPWIRDRIGRFFWTANVLFRMLLNKLFQSPPPAVVLTNQRPDLTYRQVMQRADILTVVLQLLVLQVFRLGLRLCVGLPVRKFKWLLNSSVAAAIIYSALRLLGAGGKKTMQE